jgi:hypothetical protein
MNNCKDSCQVGIDFIDLGESLVNETFTLGYPWAGLNKAELRLESTLFAAFFTKCRCISGDSSVPSEVRSRTACRF